MNKEYSVACLLDKESVTNLKKSISFLEKGNFPHVSLFQFACDNEDFIFHLQKIVKPILISQHFLTSNVAVVEKNVFLDIQDDMSLRKVSDYIAKIYSDYFPQKKYLSQINFSELTNEQLDLVEKYGIYWIKQFFRPHVTLCYDKIDIPANVSPPLFISVLQADIYEIDGLGRIKVLLDSFPME